MSIKEFLEITPPSQKVEIKSFTNDTTYSKFIVDENAEIFTFYTTPYYQNMIVIILKP